MKKNTLLNAQYTFLGLLIFQAFFLLRCPAPPTPGELINKRIVESFDDTKTMSVNFVTTRREKVGAQPSCDSNFYGYLTDLRPHYGDCTINVPAKRSVGDITLGNAQDKNQFFQLLGKTDQREDDFFNKIARHPFDEVLVFVHGFNVNFDEAVIRAGQIRYDLKFPGEVVVYSWPAGSEAGVLNQLLVKSVYESNFNEAKLNREPFASFLTKLKSTKKKIHLVVHSMGHQVVLPALARDASEGGPKVIDQLILNAPDFDKAEFSKISPLLVGISNRVTLYCSPGDNALVASQKVNGGSRAGMCHKFENIDVINVNEVDSPVLGVGGLGHGYYSSRPILSDIYQVLLGVSVEKRLFIRKSGPNNGENWILRQ
jgi:esterase/lipase superfamily enzyme